MKTPSIACIYADSEIAIETYQFFSKQIVFTGVEEADYILVLGGDGFMLHALHLYGHLKIPFYGINCGSLGFLLNHFSRIPLVERLRNAKEQVLFPLKMTACFNNGKEEDAMAFNEVSVMRHTRQTSNIRVVINDIERIPNLICDGIMVSTPAGSTAYNYSARGPIIPIGANVLALTPVSPFRPRRWNGALLPHNATIIFENLNPEKRPIYAAADFKEWPDIRRVVIREDRSMMVRLMFDPEHALEDRIFSEQFAYGE